MAGTTNFYGISYPTSTDYVKDGAVAIQTVATGFDSAVAIPTYNAQTGATYTFVLSDTGKTVTASNASASTYTIPPTSSVAWTANTTLEVTNLGAGVVTFAAGAGVTVTNTAATLAQYQSAQLVRTGLNAWTVIKAGGSASGLTLVSATTIGTGVTSVTVSSAFSATYDAYKIIVSGGTASTENTLRLTLGATATGYYAGYARTGFGTGAVNGNSDNNAASFTSIGSLGANGNQANFDLIDPFASKNTYFYSWMIGPNPASTAGTGSGYLANTTSYTAFTLTAASGNLTGGTIRVYGYQNS